MTMNQKTLPMEGLERPPRPMRQDALEPTLEQLTDEVMVWLKAGGNTYSDRDEVLNQIRDAYESSLDCFDGAKMVVALSSYHMWEVNMKLAEILDQGESIQMSIYYKMVKTWMVENDVKPAFSLGDEVAYKGQQVQVSAIADAYGCYVLSSGDWVTYEALETNDDGG